MMHDDRVFVTDTVEAALQPVDADGVVTDDHRGPDGFAWDEHHRVVIDNPPWETAFETDEFYRFEATVARPIPQVYHFDDDELVLKKPPDELRRAQWGLDNAPYPLGHPPGGLVTDADQVHGFWRRPEYVANDDAPDEQRLRLYVPTNDEDAQVFLDDHQAVSLGFHTSFDMDVDPSDPHADAIDGYQRGLVYDHVAGVRQGRCSTEDGCQIALGDATDRDDDPPSETTPTSDRGEYPVTHAHGGCTPGACSCDLHPTVTDAPSGIHTADGTWFAVGPDEHTHDSTDHPDDAMFPVGDCGDVEDAWNRRGHSDALTIEQSTLVTRIKRAAEAHDCPAEFRPWVDDTDSTDDMTDTDSDTTVDLDVSSLSLDAVAERHEGVATLRDEADEHEDRIDELTDEVERLEDEKEALADQKESLEDTVEAFEQGERTPKAELVDEITDVTDHWDAEDLHETDRETLEDRLAFAKDSLASTTTIDDTDAADPDDDTESDVGTPLGDGAVDLSDTA